MYIEHIEVAGFGGLRRWESTLERASRLDGPPRARVAVADALLLAFASWDHAAFAALLSRWGCRGAIIEGAALPEAAHWDAAPGLAAVVDRASEGLLVVGLTIAVDPPQFGKLRALAARDARLVDALAEGARVTVRVGARFSPNFDAVAIDPLSFLIGDVGFPIAGADRPGWMTAFLRGLTGRLHRGALPPEVWATHAMSWRAEDQRAVRRAIAALRAPPAGMGDLVVLADGPALLEDEAVVSMRHLGTGAQQAAGLVGAVHLSGAEILVVEDAPPAWLDWLAAQTEAEASPLEQVILLGVPGGIPIG